MTVFNNFSAFFFQSLAGLMPTDASTFTPSTTAVGDSVWLTAAVGVCPLVVFFTLLGAFKVKTHWCSLWALALSVVLAIFAFQMPFKLSLLAATQGAALGLLPIIYIIIGAVWLYTLTEKSGRSRDLRAVFNVVGKGDIRAQALIVCFSFCGLLEGLAGFGAPVAITGAMMVALGVPKIKAAVLTMVGNAINVGFGAMAIPVTTAGRLGDTPPAYVGAVMGSVTWIFAAAMPLLLLFIMDQTRGLRQLWPLALVSGGATAIGHYFLPLISYELTAVGASLLGLAASYVFMQMWTPTTPEEHRSAGSTESTMDRLTTKRTALALLPYVLVVAVIAFTKLWKWGINIDQSLKSTDVAIKWPGLYGNILTANGEPSSSAVYTLAVLSNPGTWIFVTGVIIALVYSRYGRGTEFALPTKDAFAALPQVVYNLRLSLLTIASVMALAFVMNFSGQTTAIGAALASTGTAFAFFSPLLGWTGTAVAGSATSAGALFANLQTTAAQAVSVDPGVLLAGNTIGGGIGKIVSPQNLAVAATAIDEPGSEPEILRRAAPVSIGLIMVLCALIFMASTGVLGGYMPDPESFAPLTQ